MLFSKMRHGGMACINSKISEGVLYKDMVYNKILKKETFENFAILYHTSKMGWGKETFSMRTLSQRSFSKGPLAKGPPKSKDLWSKGPLHQRTFSKRTFCPKDLLVLSLKSKY